MTSSSTTNIFGTIEDCAFCGHGPFLTLIIENKYIILTLYKRNSEFISNNIAVKETL